MCGVDEDDDFDEALFLANALNDLHRLMLKNKPHIKQYIKLRKMHGKILDSMMDYYDDGNFEQKIDKTLIPQYNSENKKGHDTVFFCLKAILIRKQVREVKHLRIQWYIKIFPM
jgi:hypothetical protein